jgi:hypothetical protein
MCADRAQLTLPEIVDVDVDIHLRAAGRRMRVVLVLVPRRRADGRA